MRADFLRLRLPATSANLGPGFDAVGLALDLWLEVEARAAERDSIEASGRDAELVGALENNLLLLTYRELAPEGPALALRIRNGIPLGMGCGSSAAALLAGVALANHFGGLGWSSTRIRDEACRREGHPDNVAACFHGGFTVSSMDDRGQVDAASFASGLDWTCLLALPAQGLRTHVARALLPDGYSRADAVRNVQSTALLVAAFAQGRTDLLLPATEDRLHQPYRLEVCPLLARLLPLRGEGAIRSVTLSGAGPSVLLILDGAERLDAAKEAVQMAAGDLDCELVATRIAGGFKMGAEAF